MQAWKISLTCSCRVMAACKLDIEMVPWFIASSSYFHNVMMVSTPIKTDKKFHQINKREKKEKNIKKKMFVHGSLNGIII